MKIHRFIDDFDLSKKTLEITGEIAKQMALVLKLEVCEKVELCDGKHISAIAEICKIDKKSVVVKLDSLLRQDSGGQRKNVTLYCAILKKENFELVVQKTTECGISKIVPIISERTIKTGLNMERLQKIAKEASEQSGRNNIPEISEPITFNEALKLIKENILNVIFDADGDLPFEIHCAGWRAEHSKFSAENYECISKDKSPSANIGEFSKINIFIGPEGGWTENEIKKAKENNFSIASLGSLTLRGETAAIIATYLISNLD